MRRTKIDDRKLPGFTRREEIGNMITHIVGAAFGLVVLVLCSVFAGLRHNYWGIAGGIVYGIMMIYLYTISSVYHGLRPERPKKIMQVLDHCSIFGLILGSFFPILFTGVREQNKVIFYIVLALVIIGTAICVPFTAIDFKKYEKVCMSGYFIVGWSALLMLYPLYKAYGIEMIIWIIGGGVVYSLGMIFFALGRKKQFFHMIFHLFILAGSILQFIGIFKFCILGG
ncbi:MAG: hemolysin III family protein [Clostridia bacterium]|nr:hemolysin III family protein [Clostridia bacterium]